MRKSLILFIVLLLSSVLFLFCGAEAVNAGRDDIVITETTLEGSVDAAEGLHVRLVPSERGRLFWITDYYVAERIVPTVDFQYYGTHQNRVSVEYQKDLYLDFGSGGFGISGAIDLENELEMETFGYSSLMLRPAADLAQRVEAGEIRTEIMRLCDFYEYYPIRLDCGWSGLLNIDSVARAQNALMSEFFRIPVPEEEFVEVTVEKDAEGRVIGIDCNTYYPPVENEAEMYVQDYTQCSSVVQEDAAYLLLTGTADYSEISGGYGLYRIPVSYVTQYENWTFSEPQALLEVEKIENVFPMDLNKTEGYILTKGITENELLLFEQKETCVTVYVLDTASCAILQRIDLQTQKLPQIWYRENLVVLGSTDYGKQGGRLQVLLYENGKYTLWLDTEFYPLNDTGHYYYEPAVSFDGTRIAVAALHQAYNAASHRITVYNQTGLVYAGDYHCNSDDLTEVLTMSNNLEEPLQLSWK